MIAKFKELLATRKGTLFTVAWVTKALTFAGGALAFWLKWNSEQVANWGLLVTHITSVLEQMGTLTTQLAGVWAMLIAVEDAFHKLQLPWFVDSKGKTVTQVTQVTQTSAGIIS